MSGAGGRRACQPTSSPASRPGRWTAHPQAHVRRDLTGPDLPTRLSVRLRSKWLISQFSSASHHAENMQEITNTHAHTHTHTTHRGTGPPDRTTVHTSGEDLYEIPFPRLRTLTCNNTSHDVTHLTNTAHTIQVVRTDRRDVRPPGRRRRPRQCTETQRPTVTSHVCDVRLRVPCVCAVAKPAQPPQSSRSRRCIGRPRVRSRSRCHRTRRLATAHARAHPRPVCVPAAAARRVPASAGECSFRASRRASTPRLMPRLPTRGGAPGGRRA